MYTFLDESSPHEATWLQWPHEYQFGRTYRDRLDATWVAMTSALVSSEAVYIIAYNEVERQRITELLNTAGVSMDNITFHIFRTNDVWARDCGPFYARDSNNELVVLDWGFNGWGNKFPHNDDNSLPSLIAETQGKELVDLKSVINVEGGGFESDGNGTFLATRSCILNKNRNPNMTQAQAEAIFTENLGVTNFIWLDGVAGQEITDMHIDGFAKFVNHNTLLTMDNGDLRDFDVPQKDVKVLYGSKNKNGEAYKIVHVPATSENVVTEFGKKLGYKGSYVNFYIANTKVLVPNYNDPNDKVANQIIQELIPDREVVGIDVRNLYQNGGMVHCVTQQQPQ